ncbi:MAG: DUF2945 domain-containing protein [Planctomycetota bacterium]
MADSFNEGDRVAWDWGNGQAEGKVVKVYHQKITLKIEGNEVTRDASEEEPAYKIEQDDGDEVLKSHSEVKSA